MLGVGVKSNTNKPGPMILPSEKTLAAINASLLTETQKKKKTFKSCLKIDFFFS